MRTLDIYWLAGLLEGEGCFSTCTRQPRITLGMTDLDTLQRAASLLQQAGIRYDRRPPRLPHHKPMYYIAVVGKRAIAWMLTLYPLMGLRRRSKIREVVGEWRTRQPRRRAA